MTSETTNPDPNTRDEVTRRIENYTPRDVPGDVWELQLRPFVVPLLHRAAPTSLPTLGQLARVLTLISAWCLEEGIPLDVERVLDPDTVERFTTTALRPIPSRDTYRTVLRRLGRKLTQEAPWPPPPERFGRRHRAVPYTAPELELLMQAAHRQSTTMKRRTALGLIALGAGAGLDGRWVADVRGSHVVRVNGCVVVRVGEPRRRSVAVLKRFEDLVAELAEEAGSGFIVHGSTSHRNRPWRLVRAFERGRGPALSVPRLRSWWLAEHLRRGTRLPELLSAAGTDRVDSIGELLAYVTPLPLDDELREVRGAG